MQSELTNQTAKFVEIAPKNLENYYGYVEEFKLDSLSATKISNYPRVLVDYLTVSIRYQEELEHVSAIFKRIVRHMKIIQLIFYNDTNSSLAERELINALEYCDKLQSLDINLRGYPKFYNPDLHKILSKLSSLRSLKFKRCLNNLTMLQLSTLLADNSTIQHLSFSNAAATDNFFQKLSASTSLKTLRINKPQLDESTWKSLCYFIASSSTLKTIEIRPITELQYFLTEFCLALKQAKSIKQVITDSYLFGNQQHFEEFLSAIQQSSCESLTIVRYSPSPITRSVLAKFLANNNTLKYLQLGKIQTKRTSYVNHSIKTLVEQVDQAEIDSLADSLQMNKTLRGIALNGWSTQVNISLKKLANVMKSNMTLLTLDMSYSHFGEDALKDIADIIANNKSLTKLNLRRTMSTYWSQVIDALISNKTLTSIDLSESVEVRTSSRLYIEAITIDVIKRLIENNTTIRELIFQARNLTENEIVELLPSLKHNESLTSIDLLAPKRAVYQANPVVLTLSPDLVADVFSTNYSIVHLKTHFAFKRLFERYLRRNRQYRLDAIIMLHNLFRSEYKVLPDEIWRHVISSVGSLVGPLEIVLTNKRH